MRIPAVVARLLACLSLLVALAAHPQGTTVIRGARLGLPVSGHVPRGLQVTDVLESGQAAIEHLADYSGVVESDDSPFSSGWH